LGNRAGKKEADVRPGDAVNDESFGKEARDIRQNLGDLASRKITGKCRKPKNDEMGGDIRSLPGVQKFLKKLKKRLVSPRNPL
jgi:hypothetical protein